MKDPRHILSTRRAALAALVAACALQAGCALMNSSEEEKEKTIIVPSTATSVPQYRADGSLNAENYVIRMSDGRRDWEVSFPSTADGYQVRIPLQEGEAVAGGPGVHWEGEQLTEADKELLEELRRQNPDMEREGIFAGGENVVDQQADADSGAQNPPDPQKPGEAAKRRSGQKSEADAAPTRPSYLMGIAEVQKLYKAGKYELAMVRLSQLDKAYPNDVKILSMKGSLWVKLGRPELARRAWEQALQLDPDNKAVAGALKRLNQ